MSGASLHPKNVAYYYYSPVALSPLMEGPLSSSSSSSSSQPRCAHLRDDAGGGRSSLEFLSWLNFTKKKQQLEGKWVEEEWNAGSMAMKKTKTTAKKKKQQQQQAMEEEELDVMKKKQQHEKEKQQQQKKKKAKNGGGGFDSRLLLGVLGCPLAPLSVSSNEPFPHLSIKNVCIEASSAQYIIYQYMAATGASRYRTAFHNAYFAGRVRMVVSETETAAKKSGGGFMARGAIAADLQHPPLPSSSSSSPSPSPSPLSLLSAKKKKRKTKRKKAMEHGRFVLWQMMGAANQAPSQQQQQQQQQQHHHQQQQQQQQTDRQRDEAHNKWHLELALGGAAIQAGSNGKMVWRYTPWLGAHAAKGQVRPLRRALQGLDPVTTAGMFAGARCMGERRVGGEDCFVLKVEAGEEELRQRSEGSGAGAGAELIRHVMTGCFSQRTGLLLALDDWHLTRMPDGGGGGASGAVYWETAIESRLSDYRPVVVDGSGVQLAHSGRSSAALLRFGAAPFSHSRSSLLESWSIDDVAFNVPGLSHDFFLPPSDLLPPKPYVNPT